MYFKKQNVSSRRIYQEFNCMHNRVREFKHNFVPLIPKFLRIVCIVDLNETEEEAYSLKNYLFWVKIN